MVGAASVEVDSVEAAFAAVEGAVEAAYRLSRSRGDRVRHSVVISILKPRRVVSPELERRLAEVAERLSEELPTGRAAWRGASLVKAVRLLINAGGIDLAACLAYFTLPSLLPLVTLVIMGVAVIGEPEGIRVNLTEVLVYYFPTSRDLIEEAVDNLLNRSLTISLIALVSIVICANGLFMAPNRAVSRVFGIETKRITQITLAEVSIATLVVTLFLFSVSLTAPSCRRLLALGKGSPRRQGWRPASGFSPWGSSSRRWCPRSLRLSFSPSSTVAYRVFIWGGGTPLSERSWR